MIAAIRHSLKLIKVIKMGKIGRCKKGIQLTFAIDRKQCRFEIMTGYIKSVTHSLRISDDQSTNPNIANPVNASVQINRCIFSEN